MNDQGLPGSGSLLPRLLLVDDDEVSRELLIMLAEAEGYPVDAAESGDSALAWLEQPGVHSPDAILTDLQMPGLAGFALAAALRNACGPATILIAMSGSRPAEAILSGFDGFLLKPFEMSDLKAALDGNSPPPPEPEATPALAILDQGTYDLLKKTMGEVQLGQLFEMCLNDAAKRMATMRDALATGDATTYKAAAHAIKGGCGLVGATELYAIANEMEIRGPDGSSLDSLARFVAASERLQRMLIGLAP